MSEKKPKIITIRVTEELHKLADRRRFEQGTSFQAILEAALSRFAQEPGAVADAASIATVAHQRSSYLAHNQRWHDELEIILNDPEERGGIEANLRWGAEAVRRKRRPKVANSGR